MTKTEITVDSILNANKKTTLKELDLQFKCEKFEIQVPVKTHRLDSKKILADRFEEMYQSTLGVRAVAKKVGYANGVLTYFPAVLNDKGKWEADINQAPIPAATVQKVIKDVTTGKIAKKDETHGLWFLKLVPNESINNWLVEETYNIWSDSNSDALLKVYDFLLESHQHGVYRFNMYGTTYNGFLYPQTVDNSHFRLLLALARVTISKPEIAPTMVIQSALIRAKERARADQMGVMSSIEEV